MNSPGSVTLWIQQLKAGDQAALHHLWEGYFPRLVAMARKKLGRSPRQAADEEDVALSAFDSFCRGVEQGRFPRLDDRDDLWHLLVALTLRKASNLARHAGAQHQGGGRVRHVSALAGLDESEGRAFAELLSQEPDPAFAAQVAEECGRLLGLLPVPLREVAVLKMEGHSNEDIAATIGRALATAERRLKDIRALWEKETAS
jgi:DNA-directed RNA polymerase specialized sigma24 family protein